MDKMQALFSLAETCQQHLAEATRRNCPSRRYSIILEELRQEVHRQVGSCGQSGFGQIPALREQDGHLVQEASTLNGVDRSGALEPPGLDFSPTLGTLQPTDLGAMSSVDDMGLLENLEGSIWWAQLDSWVCCLPRLARLLHTDSCRLCLVSPMIRLHSRSKDDGRHTYFLAICIVYLCVYYN